MARAQIREQYQGLSRAELLDKVYDLGYNYTCNSHSCSQSAVAAVHAVFVMDDLAVKVASSLSGGSASQYLGTCGALAGGVIALDYYFGRPIEQMSAEEKIQANLDALKPASRYPKLLADKFVKEYGTFICPQLQRQLFGRNFYSVDPDESRKNSAAQEQCAPRNCFGVVGDTARWVAEILLDDES